MRKVAIYGRVRTKDQNPESQLLDLRKYVKLRGVGSLSRVCGSRCKWNKRKQTWVRQVNERCKKEEV